MRCYSFDMYSSLIECPVVPEHMRPSMLISVLTLSANEFQFRMLIWPAIEDYDYASLSERTHTPLETGWQTVFLKKGCYARRDEEGGPLHCS